MNSMILHELFFDGLGEQSKPVLALSLEYILIPLAFGFGSAIVAMVGTNWGASQYRRAYHIAWIGGATLGAICALIGMTAGQ